MSQEPPRDPAQNDPEVVQPGEEPPPEVMMMMARQIAMRSGPLPEGEELEKYENTLPGAADRIVSMSENEGVHRRGLETTGLRAGVTIAVGGLLGGFLLVAFGFGYLGILFAVVGTAFPLISAFLKDRRS